MSKYLRIIKKNETHKKEGNKKQKKYFINKNKNDLFVTHLYKWEIIIIQ